MAETGNQLPKGHIPGVTPSEKPQADQADQNGDVPFGGSQDDDSSPQLIYGIRRSTLMMAVMFLVGIGWVANETRKTRSLDTAPPDSQNEALVSMGVPEVAKIASRDAGSRDEAHQQLGQSGPLGWSIADINKNPFQQPEEFLPKEPVAQPDDEPEADTPEIVEEKVPPLNIKITSILAGGSMRLAWTNLGRYNEGDTIDGAGGWFVEKIHDDRVVFRWNSKTTDKTETKTIRLRQQP